MTPSRRFAVAVIIGLVAMVSSLSLQTARDAERSSSDPLAHAIRQLASAAGDVQSAVHAYRVAQALDRWKQSRTRDFDNRSARFDREVPRAVEEPLRSTINEQWSRLGRTGTNGEVFVLVDSSAIPRADSLAAAGRSIEPRRLVDVSYALPDATDGERCVVVVRLRGTTPAHVAAAQAQSLTGICGFYAAFGLPGAGVRSWLRATRHTFARDSDWHLPRAPVVDAGSVYALRPDATRCLTGASDACRAALGLRLENRSSTASAVVGGDVAQSEMVLSAGPGGGGWQEQRVGEFQGRYLADAVRDLGPERFARFWRADASVDVAFAAAAGVGVASWTQAWLTRTYGSVTHRPSVRARDVTWLVAAVPLLLFVAARPRERLLLERLRSANR